MRPAGILFDKDGTLVDFELTWGRAVLPVLRGLSGGRADLEADLARLLLFDLGSERLAPHSPLVAGTMAEVAAALGGPLRRADLDVLRSELDRAFAAAALRGLSAVGDPVAVLDALRGRGLRLGLATNDAEASALQQLSALGIDGHLEFVAGYDSGHGGKPGPGMVLAFAALVGAPPAAILMVGDSLHDMEAARAAGAVGVAVLSGPVGRAELAPAATHVIDSIAALPALVDSLW